MTKVFTALATSVDGFIAGPSDTPEQPLGVGGAALHEWYFRGDTPSTTPGFDSFRLAKENQRVFDSVAARNGAIIAGRRTHDVSNAWGGQGPMPGVPLFVLTHRPPKEVLPGPTPYTYVTDGIESAVQQAHAAAGGKDISLMGSAAVQQALRAGLLDEILLHQVPVLLGSGVRLLDQLDSLQVDLERLEVVPAPGVTHLSFRVRTSQN